MIVRTLLRHLPVAAAEKTPTRTFNNSGKLINGMKRIIKSCTVLIVCLALFNIPCFAQTYTEGAFYYELEGESITITGYFGREEEITVPETIAGYPVNTIGSGAFAESTGVKIIHLPGTITEIQENAFLPEQQILYAENHPANGGNAPQSIPDNQSDVESGEVVPDDGYSDEEPVIIVVGDDSEEGTGEIGEDTAVRGPGSGAEGDLMEEDEEILSETELESSSAEKTESTSAAEEASQAADISAENSEQIAEKEAATRITNPAVWVAICAGVVVVVVLIIALHKKKR